MKKAKVLYLVGQRHPLPHPAKPQEIMDFLLMAMTSFLIEYNLLLRQMAGLEDTVSADAEAELTVLTNRMRDMDFYVTRICHQASVEMFQTEKFRPDPTTWLND